MNHSHNAEPERLEDLTLWRPYCQMKTAGEPLHVISAEGVWLELESGQ